MGLGSEIRKNLFWIPDPGDKKAPDPGYGSATLLKGIPEPPQLGHEALPVLLRGVNLALRNRLLINTISFFHNLLIHWIGTNGSVHYRYMDSRGPGLLAVV
jgi:hypothetical protein